jgi:hypothetical protein
MLKKPPTNGLRERHTAASHCRILALQGGAKIYSVAPLTARRTESKARWLTAVGSWQLAVGDGSVPVGTCSSRHDLIISAVEARAI